jgi:hypothetical protein
MPPYCMRAESMGEGLYATFEVSTTVGHQAAPHIIGQRKIQRSHVSGLTVSLVQLSRLALNAEDDFPQKEDRHGTFLSIDYVTQSEQL